MNNFISRITLITLLSLSVLCASASGKENLMKQLSYPELEVNPLASERLRIESEEAASRLWTNQFMFQISGLSTLVAAISTDADPGDEEDLDDAQLLGAIIGGGWLIGSSLMAHFYKPYTSGYKSIQNMKTKGKRNRITRERLAEEALHRPANWIKTLKWLSWSTNLAASAFIAGSSDDSTRAYALASGLISFLPLIFKHHWQHVSDQHKIYKKKIYGPLFTTGLLLDKSVTRKNKFVPSLNMAYSF